MIALTRRQLIFGMGAWGVLGTFGCDKEAGDAASDGLIEIGGLVFKIPHVAGKVIGVVLIAGGSALKIYFAFSDGQKEEEIPLTDGQGRKISQLLREGKDFTVFDPKGRKHTVPGRLLHEGEPNPFIRAFEEGRREALEGSRHP
jgi:hypothetical protein